MRLFNTLRRYKPLSRTDKTLAMKLNLPILDHLKDCQTVLIAGAGGGFDIFAGLPLYFTLKDAGKTVHLANYSFMDLALADALDEVQVLEKTLVIGTQGKVRFDIGYYPEGHLAQWFQEAHNEDVTVWLLARSGVKALNSAYTLLLEHIGGVDAIVLVDGGVDSLMRGDEIGAGTLLEDTISLGAVQALDDVQVKLLACIGFGSEVEENVCHYLALENIAALAAENAFYGSCALTPQMDAFAQYESACRFAWEGGKNNGEQRHKSHISTRIIPAVNGEFGNFKMYPRANPTSVFISPLMSLYWFFDSDAVANRSLILESIRDTYLYEEAFSRVAAERKMMSTRSRKSIPY